MTTSPLKKPNIVSLDLTGHIIFHQRHGVFCNGGDKPYHPTFAYFSVDKPYYEDEMKGFMNTYKYIIAQPVPKMIQLDDNFWPDDLREWVKYETCTQEIDNAHTLNKLIIDIMGYNGWFIDGQEYVFAKHVIDAHMKLSEKKIFNSIKPQKESHCDYWI